MDGLLLLVGAVVLLCTVIVPIIAIKALSRANQNQIDLKQLQGRVAALQEQLLKYTGKPSRVASKGQLAEPLPDKLDIPFQEEPPPEHNNANSDRDIMANDILHAAASTATTNVIAANQPEPVSQASPVPPASELTPTVSDAKALSTSVFKSKNSETQNLETNAAEPVTPPKQQPRPVQQQTSASEESAESNGLVSWFLKGNPLAKLGILLLFLGIAYLLKYTVERDMLPIEFRLMGAAAISGILLWVGWRLRIKQQLYALILQGGAIGALYITVFGAFQLYKLVPHSLAFGLMLVICAASVGLAVLQRALSLAMLASIGGYLSPILLSTGSGNYIGLFSYYLLLSIGILAISVWQQWRPLNLLGFIFTFSVAGMWGINDYQPEHYIYCQFFLIANIIIFGVLSIALSLRDGPAKDEQGKEGTSKEKVIDGVLLFGVPLIGFGMQYEITKHWEFGPAFSALGFGVAYMIFALLALRRYPSLGKQLGTAGLAIGGAFATLAIPLALSAQWTSIAWAIEGLGLLWFGMTQNQRKMQISGSLLLVLSFCTAVFAITDNWHLTSFSLVIIFAVLSLTWIAAAFIWHKIKWEKGISTPTPNHFFLVGGLFFWVLLLLNVVNLFSLVTKQSAALYLALFIPSVLLWRWVGKRLEWKALRYAVWLLWPCMLIVYYGLAQESYGLGLALTDWINLVWLPAFVTAYFLLKYEAEQITIPKVVTGLHLSLLWFIMFMVGVEVHHVTLDLAWGMDEWRYSIILMFYSLTIAGLLWGVRKGIWPFANYRQVYGVLGPAPLAFGAFVMLLGGNAQDGLMHNWLYLPLINPLEESSILAILILWWWGRSAEKEPLYLLPLPKQSLTWVVIGLFAWWGNGVILRALSYYGDIPWWFDALWGSRLVQTTFALLWMLAALITMIWATRHHSRTSWFSGAVLLCIVIAKLFLIDSARGGGLARAIAFIGVAVLVLIIGYFSPLPPREESDRTSNTASERGDI